MNGPAGEPQVLGAASSPFRGAQWTILAAVTAFGAILRFWGLDTWAFWVDEAHTWRDATLPDDIFWSCNRSLYPTSYLALRWMLDVADPSTLHEGMLRLPFALAGIVSVPLLAWVGRPLVGNAAALFASLLLAINPWHIYWSQNARSYSFVFLFALIAGGWFWFGMQRKSRAHCLSAMGVVLLGVSCHPTAGLQFAPMVAFPLLANRAWDRKLVTLLVALTVVAFAAVPFLAHVPPFEEFIRAKSTPDLGHLAQTVAFYFRLSLLLAAVTGAWIAWQDKCRQRSLYLSLWMALPLLALAVLGSSLMKATSRYAFCTLPAVLLLASVGCVRVFGAVRDAYAASGRSLRLLPATAMPLLVCLDLLVYDFHYFTVQHGDRGLWQQAAAQIHDLEPSGNVTVLTVNEPTMHFYLRRWHYSGDAARIAQMTSEVTSIETYDLAGSGGAASWFAAQRERSRRNGRTLYAVVTLPELREKDPDHRLQQAIQSEMDLVAAYPMSVGPKDETIFVYRARAAK